MPAKAPQVRKASPVLLAMVAVLLLCGAGAFWYFARTPVPRQLPQLTSDARTYVRSLNLAETQMKATSSYLGTTIVEITGKITNGGDRPLRLVELNCVFADPYGQVILRERVPIVRDKGARFQPGETRSFRLPFDSIPQTWNQVMPQLVIARIDFDE